MTDHPHDTTGPFHAESIAALPHILGTIDVNAASRTVGVADRFHWAWGLIDFPNGTFQGTTHGMARLWANGLWPYPTDPDRFISRIDAMIRGIDACRSPDGSLSEAFPYEGSWCVTALGAYDALATIDLLRGHVDELRIARWAQTVEPLVNNLRRTTETHAVISNHLAAGAAALARWAGLTGCDRSRREAMSLVDRVLSHQHDEGWYLEYQGADPGYQSLATYYLADLAVSDPVDGLMESLHRSVEFLGHCVHPDGSFGGYYGSRNTRFYVPAGFHLLASHSPMAASIARRMAASVAERTVVTLAAIDAPNMPPLFNAYCIAATLPVNEPGPALPCDRNDPERSTYTGAGLLFDRGERHYTVISTKKGGVVHHYVDGRARVIDSGVLFTDRRGRFGSTQQFDNSITPDIDGNRVTVTSRVTKVVTDAPTPWQFLVLRLANVSILRSRRIREWVKRRLVERLITRPATWSISNRRTIDLGIDLTVVDEPSSLDGFDVVESSGPFTAIHMASQGYWQLQDETSP